MGKILKELTAIPKSVVSNILSLKIPGLTTKRDVKNRVNAFLSSLVNSYVKGMDPEIIKEVTSVNYDGGVDFSELTEEYFFISGDLYEFIKSIFSPTSTEGVSSVEGGASTRGESKKLEDQFEDYLRPLTDVFHYRLISNKEFALKMIKSVFCGK